MAFFRLMVLMAIPLAVVYLSALAYLCARHRGRLAQDYQAMATDRERDAFVQAAVRAYAVRIRGWLAMAVFGIPLAGLAVYIYVTNFL